MGWQLERKLRSLFRRSSARIADADVDHPAQMMEIAHQIEKPFIRMHVPPDWLRMQGAFTFGSSHPFVHALDNGPSLLKDFYAACQPADLLEYYGLSGYSELPPWELPWYYRTERRPPPGEGSLSAEHGVSFLDPSPTKRSNLNTNASEK